MLSKPMLFKARLCSPEKAVKKMNMKMPWINHELCGANNGKCGICHAQIACDRGVLYLSQDSSGEERVLIDMERCMRCGDCENACIGGALKMI